MTTRAGPGGGLGMSVDVKCCFHKKYPKSVARVLYAEITHLSKTSLKLRKIQKKIAFGPDLTKLTLSEHHWQCFAVCVIAGRVVCPSFGYASEVGDVQLPCTRNFSFIPSAFTTGIKVD